MQTNIAMLNIKPGIWFLIAAVSFVLSVAGCSKSPAALVKKARTTDKVAEFQKCCSTITDQNLIGDIVLTGDSWGRRRTALDYVTDKAVLSKIIAESKDSDIQEFASQRLSAIEEGYGLDDVPVIHWVYIGKPGKIIYQEEGYSIVNIDKSGTKGSASDAPKATWDQCSASIGKKSDFKTDIWIPVPPPSD